MSCAVGLISGNTVWIGADSAMTDDLVMIDRHPKVFRRGDGIVACCGSRRVVQVLGTSSMLPSFMDMLRFVDALREELTQRGALEHGESGWEKMDANLLIGHRGRLYGIDGDFSVNEFADGWAAIGEGRAVALGVLFAMKETYHLDPFREPSAAKHTIKTALEAAAHYCKSVRPPFTILSTGENEK